MAKSSEVKLAIFGRAGVGKSALVVRFLTKRFIWEYDPTLESTYRHQATIDDEVVTMEILDTAGQEDTIQREGHMRWGEGFVLVYDVTDRGSFEEVLPLKNILDEIKKPKNVTLILVGNKADLDHSRQLLNEVQGLPWLRIHLPMQETWVRAPVREDRTCRGATKPVSHNY
ncbi:ras-related and estrogen-regulated growth inhibitor isoform X2 [Eubalaena glacialis]|uniref:ras-related and estrogen-regulated growth inhibitor isoform X2 n=1 Tax=Eubalaena glacialis TaxID=27606 RepID=UPI002A5ADF36|nr:ras-related and estrogen-regulated growth inhibitor isoform X2 [Eubalaena glacialis]